MSMGRKDFTIDSEHKEVGKDILNVIISYTPLSGIFDTAKFAHKWLYRKRSIHRVARFIKRSKRRFRMKYMNSSPDRAV